MVSDFSSAIVSSGAESPKKQLMRTRTRFQQHKNATSSQELLPDEKCTRIVEDDPRSDALEDKLEKHHRWWYQFYDKTLEVGLTDKTASDPRR